MWKLQRFRSLTGSEGAKEQEARQADPFEHRCVGELVCDIGAGVVVLKVSDRLRQLCVRLVYVR